MEIFTTFGLFFLFSFLYGIGWMKDDFVLEILGSFGLFILGIIWFSTGLQISVIDPATGTLYEKTLMSASPGGFLLGFVGVMTLLYCGSSITKSREK